MIRLAKAMMKLGKKCCIFAESIDGNLLNQICENDIGYKIVSNSKKRITDFIKEREDVYVITLLYLDYIRIKYITCKCICFILLCSCRRNAF